MNLNLHPTRIDRDAEGFCFPWKPITLIRKVAAPPSIALSAAQREAQIESFRHNIAGLKPEAILDMARLIAKEYGIPASHLAFSV